MNFEDTVQRHLDAIDRRDLDAFSETVAPDEVVLITAQGEVSTSAARFLDVHREWFASRGWKLGTRMLHQREGTDLATCVIELDYREDGNPEGQRSILSLVFQRRGDRWLLVQDQNTPIPSA